MCLGTKSTEVVGRGKKPGAGRGGGEEKRRKLGRGGRAVGRRKGKRRIRLCE